MRGYREITFGTMETHTPNHCTLCWLSNGRGNGRFCGNTLGTPTLLLRLHFTIVESPQHDKWESSVYPSDGCMTPSAKGVPMMSGSLCFSQHPSSLVAVLHVGEIRRSYTTGGPHAGLISHHLKHKLSAHPPRKAGPLFCSQVTLPQCTTTLQEENQLHASCAAVVMEHTLSTLVILPGNNLPGTRYPPCRSTSF